MDKEICQIIQSEYIKNILYLKKIGEKDFKGLFLFINHLSKVTNKLSYLSNFGYKVIYALDLNEIIRYSTPLPFKGKVRRLYYNPLFSQKSIEFILKNEIPFSILPGTIFEAVRYLLRLCRKNKAIISKFEGSYSYNMDSSALEEDKIYNIQEFNVLSNGLSLVVNELNLIDSVANAFFKLLASRNYIPSVDLLEDVPKGIRRYRNILRELEKIDNRSDTHLNNIADAINLSIIPSINSTAAKNLVTLITRTPSFNRISESNVLLVTQRIIDKEIPIYNNPALIHLISLIDPFNYKIDSERFFDLSGELSNYCQAILYNFDKLSLNLEKYKQANPNDNSIFMVSGELKKLFDRPQSQLVNEFIQIYKQDMDEGRQFGYSLNKYEKDVESELANKELSKDVVKVKALEVTEKVVNLALKLASGCQFSVEQYYMELEGEKYYYITDGLDRENPLTRIGFGVYPKPPDDNFPFRRILIYPTLKPEEGKYIAGINLFEDGWINIYWEKSCSIEEIINNLQLLFDINDEILLIVLSKSGSLQGLKAKVLDITRQNIFQKINDLPIKIIRIESENLIISHEEEAIKRNPYTGIRFHGKVPSRFIEFYKKIDPFLPADLMQIFLKNENMLKNGEG